MMKKALLNIGLGACLAVGLCTGLAVLKTGECEGAGAIAAQTTLADDGAGRWRLFQGTYDHHDENIGVIVQIKALFRIDTKTGSCSVLVSRLKADKTYQRGWVVIP